MAGYSGTPLAKKLGIAAKFKVCAVNAPGNYLALLEPLPKDLIFTSKIDATTHIAHFFTKKRASLSEALAVFRAKLSPHAVVWISWPKRASRVPTEVTEDTVRELPLPLGFVDVKVCAIDAIWSGLKLVVRKELR